MENKYSKLYKKTFRETLSKLEIEIKDFMIVQKRKHKNLNKTHNLILERLTITNSKDFYLLSENALSEILNIYEARYGEYEEAHVYLIFDDMFKEFKLISDIKPNFSFNDLIFELAKIKAINSAYTLFRNSSRISDLMYENNNFNKFCLRKISGNIENDKLFKEQYWIKTNRENPGLYINQEDFENKENQAQCSLNNHMRTQIFNDFSPPKNKPLKTKIKSKPKETVNFNIIEKYKNNLILMYDDFKLFFIDEQKTKNDDFINVFTKKGNQHSSKIYFKCSTQAASLLLFKLKFCFLNFEQNNIVNSKLFFSKNENNLEQDNISHGLKPFRDYNALLNFTEIDYKKLYKSLSDKQIDAIFNIEKLIVKLNKSQV